ncbi:SDR family oxidoreductase [Aestuariicella hydrocarbonica]|uniref:SDR family oxidoreductase n=1 Tax=Pseudomaricurvus hydrocarbonicus TaxID=1470433 RepID=A0A9E5MN64_9GAMM|nr:SDR family oxidoreductase [Aestuariicella hydrocarbonica]NHO67346.1 SDR family oxidoreductase [Aestuariicella hydrocarbonica]
MKLSDKVAFITGGGGGIGAGIAQAFAEKGMKLVLADINLAHAEEQAKPFGDNAIALQIDVTSLESWAVAKAVAYETFGRVDVLCNNAGISQPRQPLDQVPPDTFAKVMAVNTTGVYNGVVTFADDMRQRGSGHIVNTASMNGLLAFGTFGAYSASKFAVTAMSEALRDELAPYNVGVSVLFPGLTRSRMSEADIASGDIPEEVAAQGLTDPVYLGRAVANAIENNQLYVISHPVYKAVLEKRYAEILAAHGQSAQEAFGTSD